MAETEGTPSDAPPVDGGSDPKVDDGDLKIQVGVENGQVIILYSQQLSTVSMPPEAAETMANALIRHASDARKLAET